MIHRETGRRAIAQVKTGTTPVDLKALAAAAISDMETYAFATSGSYLGDAAGVTEVIETADLLRFVRECESLLPPRIRTWFQLATETSR